jgi:hypothetical protein
MFMTSSFKPACLLRTGTCLCLALAISSSVRCQAAPVASQQEANAQDGLQTPDPYKAVDPVTHEPLVHFLAFYQIFLDHVAWEDDQQRSPRKSQINFDGPIDYSAAIGIGKDEEQTMLAICLDAYHRRTENERGYWAAVRQRIQQNGPQPFTGIPDPAFVAMGRENWAILAETRAKLQQGLSEESFQKVDAYIRGSKWSARDVLAELNYSEIVGITADEEQVMRTICLDAFNQTRENDRQFGEASRVAQTAKLAGLEDQYAELAAKRDAFGAKRPVIYEEAVARLKQELGEETFNKVATWVVQVDMDLGSSAALVPD